MFRAIVSQQSICVENVCIAHQQRLRKSLIKCAQGGNRFRQTTALLIGRGEIVSDIVANIACMWFSAAQRINRFREITIEVMSIADRQPRQRSSILGAVLACKRLNSGIGLRRAVLQKLLRHWLEGCRSDERLMNPTEPRRVAF